MTARVRWFAAAGEAAGRAEGDYAGATLGELLEGAVEQHGERLGRVAERCAILVDGVRVDDPATPLREGALVDVLPPFAGG
ncbi:MoaD/ThiS family protein [Kytococcus sp. Marseille-QA3725]